MQEKFQHEQDAFTAFLSGDERGLDYFFHAHYSMLVCYSAAITNHQPASQEITSEAFLKLWRYHHKIRGHLQLKAFLIKAVRFASIDYLRANKVQIKQVLLQEGQAIENYPSTLDTLIEAETYHEIFKALVALPPKCAEILRRFYFEHQDHEEIAKEMGIQVATVRSQKHRAIRLLKMRLVKGIVAWLWLVILP